MMADISNSDDLIDSRDVITRIAELELDTERDEADDDELAALQVLAEEVSGYAPGWEHGSVLIRDSYFRDYAQDLASDIGAIDANATWPVNCIDWEQATQELQMDYTSVSFDGVDYWIR